MSNIQLSKDADALICLIYKYYLELRNNGIFKSDAKLLGSSQDIFEKIVPSWNLDDVDDTCNELEKNDFYLFYMHQIFAMKLFLMMKQLYTWKIDLLTKLKTF